MFTDTKGDNRSSEINIEHGMLGKKVWKMNSFSRKSKKLARNIISFVGLGLLSSQALGYGFVPTEAEYHAWPDYCKLVYSRTTIGESVGRNRVSAEVAANGAPFLGDRPFGPGGVHHFCAGRAWFQRAQLEMDPREYDRMIRQAVRETTFTYNRIDASTPLYVDVSVHMARVLYERGEVDRALRTLDETIEAVPNHPAPYSLKGILLYREDRMSEAVTVLNDGNQRSQGQNAEIHYNLGLILLEMKKTDVALAHGKQAYALGYPLPGLKRRLQRAGVWEEG